MTSILSCDWLQVRTAFLGQMAGQSRAVVDRTVAATRYLVVVFTKIYLEKAPILMWW